MPDAKKIMPDEEAWLKTLGERLADLRGRRSQGAVAESVGISVSTLSRYERAEMEPGAVILAKLLFVLQADPATVLALDATQRAAGDETESLDPWAVKTDKAMKAFLKTLEEHRKRLEGAEAELAELRGRRRKGA